MVDFNDLNKEDQRRVYKQAEQKVYKRLRKLIRLQLGPLTALMNIVDDPDQESENDFDGIDMDFLEPKTSRIKQAEPSVPKQTKEPVIKKDQPVQQKTESIKEALNHDRIIPNESLQSTNLPPRFDPKDLDSKDDIFNSEQSKKNIIDPEKEKGGLFL